MKEYIINSKKYGNIKVLLDDEDYDKVKATGYSLAVSYDKTIRGFYVQFTKKPKNSDTRRLSRFITNCPKDLVVDHINRNTLDNRKCNLKVCTQFENMQNRSNNKTGTVGVRYYKSDDTYVAELFGKFLGQSKDINKAIAIRKEAERKYFEEVNKIGTGKLRTTSCTTGVSTIRQS